jgi:hypothetical protein
MLAMGFTVTSTDFYSKASSSKFTSDIIGASCCDSRWLLYLMHLHWLKPKVSIIFSSCSRICSLNGIAVSTVEGEHTAAGFTTVNVGNGFTVTNY